jgi:hypothetical protein
MNTTVVSQLTATSSNHRQRLFLVGKSLNYGFHNLHSKGERERERENIHIDIKTHTKATQQDYQFDVWFTRRIANGDVKQRGGRRQLTRLVRLRAQKKPILAKISIVVFRCFFVI